jgi:hypothetical protein
MAVILPLWLVYAELLALRVSFEPAVHAEAREQPVQPAVIDRAAPTTR